MKRSGKRQSYMLAALMAVLAWASLGQRAAAQNMPEPCEGEGSISGSILDEAGDAIEGAAVMVMGPSWVEIESDVAGAYTAEGLCAGEYYVLATLESPDAFGFGFHDLDGNEEPDAIELTETVSELTGIDVTMELFDEDEIGMPGPGRGGEPVEPCEDGAGSIEGRVLDAADQGVAGASVQIAGPSWNEIETDDTGAYRAEGLCDGSYSVAAFAEHEDELQFGFHDADADGMPDEVVLDENGREATDIDVRLEPCESGIGPDPEPEPEPLPIVIEPEPGCDNPAASIEGSVTVDDAGVAGAMVLTMNEAGAFAEAVTDDAGNYRIEGLCAGEYLVVAQLAEDMEDLRYGFYDPNEDGDPDLVNLDTDDAAETGIDIALTERWQPFGAGGAGFGNCPSCIPLEPILPAKGWTH